jgi:hypothetical protein
LILPDMGMMDVNMVFTIPAEFRMPEQDVVAFVGTLHTEYPYI